MREPETLPIRSVAITGGLGNLATKLFRHLATVDGIERLIGLDIQPASAGHASQLLTDLTTNVSLRYIECNLRDFSDERWRTALSDVDAIVHFAADNSNPQGFTQCQHR